MTYLTPTAAYSELVPTFIGYLSAQDEPQPLVDARNLHEFLNVETQFKDWIKRRIADYGFVEGVDYTCCSNLSSGENQSLSRFWGGHNHVDYHLSLDMAKELAMVERSDKGREVRRYFIAVERAVREQEIPALTRHTQAEAARLADLVEALQDEYCRRMPDMARLLRYRGMGLTYAEIGKLLDLSKRSVARRV